MTPLGDTAIVVQLGGSIDITTHQKVKMLSTYLEEHPFPGMIECVPAFTSVTVFYDPMKLHNPHTGKVWWKSNVTTDSPYHMVHLMMEEMLHKLKATSINEHRTIEIPICYGGELGPDLEYVARHNGMTSEEVIEIHSAPDYLVYMIGFAPGFPYLGGMSEKIATPRRDSPRLSIPAGTVGIGGQQTGIYPIGTPGGWQLIGKTPLALFRPKENPPSLLQAGDLIRFRPISREEYELEKGDHS